MKKTTYEKMIRPFRETPQMAVGLHRMNQACTGCMYLAYPILLLWTLLHGGMDETLIKMVLVPAFGFVTLTIVRKIINRPRPYEAFQLPPVIKKDTKGNSFPSRHVFSAMMIAVTFLLGSPYVALGGAFVAVALLLAVVRVISGVHYISDVAAGAGYALILGLIGYVLL